MACFAVPAAEAIIVTTAYFVAKKRELKLEAHQTSEGSAIEESTKKISFSRKLGWLVSLLWGGVALLALEHIWHGEIVPFAPFLTAMSTPEGTREMLHEMATVGVLMAANVTAVWGVACAVVDARVKKVKAALIKEV